MQMDVVQKRVAPLTRVFDLETVASLQAFCDVAHRPSTLHIHQDM